MRTFTGQKGHFKQYVQSGKNINEISYLKAENQIGENQNLFKRNTSSSFIFYTKYYKLHPLRLVEEDSGHVTLELF